MMEHAFQPIVARTRLLARVEGPSSHDCVRIVFVRNGSADLFGEFGRQGIGVGDAVLLGPGVICGAIPDEELTYTAIALDTDYAIDQLFWRHAGHLADRYDAEDFAVSRYPAPFQVLRLGEALVGRLASWLDELVELSSADQLPERFNRMQALWFAVADVIDPFIDVADVLPPAQTHPTISVTLPRVRRFAPIRADVRTAALLLHADPGRRWTVAQLASEVHLSRSQLSLLFTAAFGRAPVAYLTILRARRMATYLRETDLSVEAIAHRVGWRSRSHAAAAFRQLVGLSPGEYRRLRSRRP